MYVLKHPCISVEALVIGSGFVRAFACLRLSQTEIRTLVPKRRRRQVKNFLI